MIINEYRVINNCTEEEYQVGKFICTRHSFFFVQILIPVFFIIAQLYATACASKEQTGGGEGVEVVKNEPYEKENEKGQYTYKIFRLASRVPAIVRAILPAGALDLYEEVRHWEF